MSQRPESRRPEWERHDRLIPPHSRHRSLTRAFVRGCSSGRPSFVRSFVRSSCLIVRRATALRIVSARARTRRRRPTSPKPSARTASARARYSPARCVGGEPRCAVVLFCLSSPLPKWVTPRECRARPASLSFSCPGATLDFVSPLRRHTQGFLLLVISPLSLMMLYL